MTEATGDRALLVKFLTDMHMEQASSFRHYDAQRSTVTAITTSLSAALLGLIAFVWQGDTPPKNVLPVCGALVVVSLMGLVLVIKLFERSQVNRSLAEAYLNTLTALLGEDADALLRGRVQSIKYVENAWYAFVSSKPPVAPFEIRFPQGRRVCRTLDRAAMTERLNAHNPIEPRDIVVPVHNASVRIGPLRIASYDEWKLWAYLNSITCGIGAGIAVWALWP